uniref:Uncharacterized protein n=1 Tax=Oryza meridionalis TaxID=40149 RepID=A0A0E0CFD1_9ORYZ
MSGLESTPSFQSYGSPHSSFLFIQACKFWGPTRMVYLPMAYLYGKKFVGPITQTILALREEIYTAHYCTIDWAQARIACAEEDLVCPRTLLQYAVWSWLYRWVEPVLSSWAMNKLRERALDTLMEHIHYEDDNSHFLCLCPINKVRTSAPAPFKKSKI